MRNFILVLASFLFTAVDAFAFPVSYCADEAVRSAEETSDHVEDGYIHHQGCDVLKIVASGDAASAKTGSAIVQCDDDKTVVVLVALKVVKSKDGLEETCSVRSEFLRKP